MDSRDLTPDQARKLWEQIGPQLRYLGRLRRRMEVRGFLPNDKLRQLVEKAYDATHQLSMSLHYLSCEGGVGDKRR